MLGIHLLAPTVRIDSGTPDQPAGVYKAVGTYFGEIGDYAFVCTIDAQNNITTEVVYEPTELTEGDATGVSRDGTIVGAEWNGYAPSMETGFRYKNGVRSFLKYDTQWGESTYDCVVSRDGSMIAGKMNSDPPTGEQNEIFVFLTTPRWGLPAGLTRIPLLAPYDSQVAEVMLTRRLDGSSGFCLIARLIEYWGTQVIAHYDIATRLWTVLSLPNELGSYNIFLNYASEAHPFVLYQSPSIDPTASYRMWILENGVPTDLGFLPSAPPETYYYYCSSVTDDGNTVYGSCYTGHQLFDTYGILWKWERGIGMSEIDTSQIIALSDYPSDSIINLHWNPQVSQDGRALFGMSFLWSPSAADPNIQHYVWWVLKDGVFHRIPSIDGVSTHEGLFYQALLCHPT